jgi:hypothetical protein
MADIFVRRPIRRSPVAKISGQRGPWKKNCTTMRQPVVSGSMLVMDKTRIDKMRAPAKEIRRTRRGGRKMQVAAKTNRPPAVDALAIIP